MSLIKVTLLNSVGVATKVISALVLNKILAIYVGPAGYAIIGQFQNVITITSSIAGGILSIGVTKVTAQHFDDEAKQYAAWKTAIRFSLISSLVMGLSLLFLANRISEWLLQDINMSNIFIWLAFVLPAIAINNILIAIVNGKKEVAIFVLGNIFGSFLSLLVVGSLTYGFGLNGALIAFVINPAIGLIATAGLVAHRQWFQARFLWGKINHAALRELSAFGLMGLTTALAAPIAYMLIRDYLIINLGLLQAGYWQATWKISELYLMLVTTTLSLYYLPRLAEIKTAHELKKEIVGVYYFVMPLVLISALTIYLLQDFIILSLFSSDFSPMRILMPWQLAGDVIKIGSFILANVMLGRAMVKMFIVTEVIFSTNFVLLTLIFVKYFGLEGVAMAFMINYSLYWVLMIFLVRHEMSIMKINTEEFSK